MMPRTRTMWPAVKPRIRRRGFALRIRRRGDNRPQRTILPPLTMRWRLLVRSLRPVATPLAERPAGSLLTVHAHPYRAGISVRVFGARSAPEAPIASAPTTKLIERRLLRMGRPSEQVTAPPSEAVPASVISTRLTGTVLSLRRDRIFGNMVPSGPARRSAVPPSATELRQIIERSYHWSERAAAARPSPFSVAGMMRGRTSPFSVAGMMRGRTSPLPVAGMIRGQPSSSGRRQASPRPDRSLPNRSASTFQDALRARPNIRQGMVLAVPLSSIGGYRRRDDVALAAKPSAVSVPIVWRRAVADRTPGADRQATAAAPETGAGIGPQAAARPMAALPASTDALTAPETGHPGPAARPQTVLDAALIDRLAVDIIGRIDRRARIERERRGL
jgi:hypothetical protein